MSRYPLILTLGLVMLAIAPAVACDQSAFAQIPLCEAADTESDPGVIARSCPYVYFSLADNGLPSSFFLHVSQENAELEKRLQTECSDITGEIMETVAFFELFPEMRVYLGRSN
jgi:hypothetical protein